MKRASRKRWVGHLAWFLGAPLFTYAALWISGELWQKPDGRLLVFGLAAVIAVAVVLLAWIDVRRRR